MILPKGETLTYILLGVIFFLGVVILLMCSSKKKSTFGKNSSSFTAGITEATSVKPKIADDSVLIFYAPWCGHCKNSMDEFKKAVERGQGKVILIDSTDEANTSLTEEYAVKGFPTIIRGDKSKFSGSRTADDIIDFFKNVSS
jgi:thiol-disulfide isomerase/thioredoxin